MKRLFLFPPLLLSILLFPQQALPAPGSPLAEIDSLLAHVTRLEGAVFIRNGIAHTASEAESHLRMKWKRQEARIRSAEDFIERCASRSFLTGKPYRVRFADGTVLDAGAMLREELQRLRNRAELPAIPGF